MIIETKDLDPRYSYKLMISAVIPRPIAFISTVNEEGDFNCAPFSYFQGITSNPPLFMISIGRHKDIPKDTVQNIKKTGEFVINVVTEDILDEAVASSHSFPPEIDEFNETGLTPLESKIVKAPRIKESPVNIECRLDQILELGRTLQYMVIGEGLCYHIRDEVLDEKKTIDPHKLKAVGRLGGAYYCRVNDIVKKLRPRRE